MKYEFKKLLAVVVMMVMIVSFMPPKALGAAYNAETDFETLEARFWEDQKPPIGFYINAASRYILETVPNPAVGSTFGEWSVMDLLRGQYTGYDYMNYIPSNYYSEYIRKVEQHVSTNNGVLDLNKSTEWSRITLAFSALGHDIRNVAGYDFVEKLSSSHRFSYRQGINGPIWEIIALNTGGYQLYPDAENPDVNTIGKMIDYILKLEITQVNGTVGGWALTGKMPDADITGMALQAFAPYYLNSSLYNQTGASKSYTEFAKAVERALVVLTEIQQPNGGFSSWGTVNLESTVQVIVALTAMGLDPLAPKISLPHLGTTVDYLTEGAYRDGVWSNNMLDALLSFWAPGSGSSVVVGGFKHVTSGYDGGGGSGTGVNAMATDQALYGLIAYDRFLKGKKPLYDMKDMINGEYKNMRALQYQIEFDGNHIASNTTQTFSPYALVSLPKEANVYSWNTKADGTGVKYAPGEKLVMPEHSIKLYAQSEQSSNSDNVQNIKKAVTLIEELPDATQVKRDDEAQVTRARAAYEKLTAREKESVENYSKLLTIEGKLSQVLSKYDEDLQVTNLIQTIDSIAAVDVLTADYEIAINNARRAYNALTVAQRRQITNIDKLNMLEAKMAILIETAKAEHETGVNAANQVNATIAIIQALPTVQEVKVANLLEVNKARIRYDALDAVEKAKVTNYTKLVSLEEKLKQLNEQALDKEELENEINDATYSEMKIIGNKMAIESNKSTGNFLVQVPVDAIEKLDSDQINMLEVTDVRGVKIEFNAKELLQTLAPITPLAKLQIEISQYDYDSGLFEVKVQAIDREDKIKDVKMQDTYIKMTIPYSFFIDGKNLDKHVLLRALETENVAVSHISDATKLTLNVRKGGVFQFVNSSVSFTDIAHISNKDDILYLANRHVIKGNADGTFNPSVDISRAHFATMIVRALGLEAQSTSTPFVDTKGKWYEQDVQALYEAGIINGTSAKTFSPDKKLTRQQAALIMARVLRYAGVETAAYEKTVSYKDNSKISKEALNDISILANLGIMSGSNQSFNPQNNLKRSQMAKILRKTLAIAELL